MTTRTRAIFFDLYETLITEFDPEWQPRPTPAMLLGIDPQAFDAGWRARHEARMTDVHADFSDVLRTICAALGRPPADEVIERLRTERLADKATPFSQVEEHILCMLGELQQQGVTLGLISNCAPEEVARWETSPLAAFFERPVFSCRVGFAKPDIRIYHLACERHGVVPEKSAFVGDGGSGELEGAARAGMTPFQATWFLDLWPEWKQPRIGADPSFRCPKLTSPAQVMEVVATRIRV